MYLSKEDDMNEKGITTGGVLGEIIRAGFLGFLRENSLFFVLFLSEKKGKKIYLIP